MAELTAEWSRPGGRTQSVADGIEGEVLSLSTRVATIERTLKELASQETAASRCHSGEIKCLTEPSLVAISEEHVVHSIPHGSMEWPRPFWSSSCGWKLGLARSEPDYGFKTSTDSGRCETLQNMLPI